MVQNSTKFGDKKVLSGVSLRVWSPSKMVHNPKNILKSQYYDRDNEIEVNNQKRAFSKNDPFWGVLGSETKSPDAPKDN
jgi:hypothetical protein